MLTEIPADARILLRSDPASPFSEKARIIQKYIHKLERPTMSDDHPFCTVINNDVDLALASIHAIRREMCADDAADSELPRAIHSRLGSIGIPLLEWCLWVLKDMTFAFTNCAIHNNDRIEVATKALVVLNALIGAPRGLQIVLRSESRCQEVVDIVVHAWASSAALAFWRHAVFPSTILLDKLNASPEFNVLVRESQERYMPTVPLCVLRHVAAFSHRDLEVLPDPDLKRQPVEVHIQLMTHLCMNYPSECLTLFIRHKAADWVCRALARVLTIPFEDWAFGGAEREVLVNPFEAIVMFLDCLFKLDFTLISMKGALHHRLVRSLVRCISELSRQKRLGQGHTEGLNCAPVLKAVIIRLCIGVRKSGSILRLACRAMDTLDLAQEEEERHLSKREFAALWSAWDELKKSVAEARKEWVVDPNVRSGRRCMNPQCTAPYARRLKRCTACQFLVVCSRACQEYVWTTLDHGSHCFNLASCSLAAAQKDEEHDFENCRCSRFTLI
ncbi:hypothetical protein BDZ89DRAFT_1158575 [Hymenopellis radicata]|nr:hypothetical protein BDZ89DRAFT_1158575 [Hymenopellis radicata]